MAASYLANSEDLYWSTLSAFNQIEACCSKSLFLSSMAHHNGTNLCLIMLPEKHLSCLSDPIFMTLKGAPTISHCFQSF